MIDEKVILPFRVTKETRRQLKMLAAEHDTSINQVLNRAVDALLNGKPVAAARQAEPKAA
jgi:hypothetical protein